MRKVILAGLMMLLWTQYANAAPQRAVLIDDTRYEKAVGTSDNPLKVKFSGDQYIEDDVSINDSLTVGQTIRVGNTSGKAAYNAIDDDSTLQASSLMNTKNDLFVEGDVESAGALSANNSLTVYDGMFVLSGNVGIGTSTPGSKLDVIGSMMLTGPTSDYTILRLAETAQNNFDIQYIGSSNTVQFISGSYQDPIQIDGANLYLQSQNTAGNVGIGTTSPVNTLDIAGGVGISKQLTVAGTTDATSKFIANSVQTKDILQILDDDGTTIYGDVRPDGDLSWGKNSLYVDCAGNVGIGTSSPTAPLEFVGTTYPNARFTRTTAAVSAGGSVNELLLKTSGDMIDGFGPGLLFSVQDATAAATYISGIYCQRDGADNSGSLIFKPISSGTFVNAMTIKSSGNVGIGTTSPVNKLDVSGNLSMSGNLSISTSMTTTGAGTGATTYIKVHINGQEYRIAANRIS